MFACRFCSPRRTRREKNVDIAIPAFQKQHPNASNGSFSFFSLHKVKNLSTSMFMCRPSYTTIFSLVLALLAQFASADYIPPLRCNDDRGWTFGWYKALNGKKTTRTCAWITEDPTLAASRRDEWCNHNWIPKGFETGNVVKDKCPYSCGNKKECRREVLKDCTDKVPSNNYKWHDKTGETFDCKWYAYADHCEIFGWAYRKFDMTAQEACCVCGGGAGPGRVQRDTQSEIEEDAVIEDREL